MNDKRLPSAIATCVVGFILVLGGMAATICLLTRLLQTVRGITPADVWRDARAAAEGVPRDQLSYGLFAEGAETLSQRMAIAAGTVLPKVHRAQRAARRECNRACQCTRGGLVGYGRYCGYKYTGCEGYGACDAVDACCLAHDACVTVQGYTDCNCTVALAKCVACSGLSADGVSPSWCATSFEVAAVILADVLFLLPACFERAEREALATAVDLTCRVK